MEYTILERMIGSVYDSVAVVDEHWHTGNEALVFKKGGKECVVFSHSQDCCEFVVIEDIVGDLPDLEGSPLVEAEVASHTPPEDECTRDDAEEWTYFKFGTTKGCVSVRWCGASNGYYSMNVGVFYEEHL